MSIYRSWCADTQKEVPEILCRPPPFGTVCQADGHVDEPRDKSHTTAAQLQGAGTIRYILSNHASDALTRTVTVCCMLYSILYLYVYGMLYLYHINLIVVIYYILLIY